SAPVLVMRDWQEAGDGDRITSRTVAGWKLTGTVAVTKVARLSRHAVVAALARAAEVHRELEVFPVSARTGEGVEALLEHLRQQMPEGPFVFAEGATSDQPPALLLAELVRESVIVRTFQEQPQRVAPLADNR